MRCGLEELFESRLGCEASRQSQPPSHCSLRESSRAVIGRLTVPRDPRPQFVLMLYEDSNYETASSAEPPGRIAEYGGWARSLGSQNYVTGQKLVESESTVSRSGIVGPTPPAQKAGSVAGYFIIRAADADEAARVAATCPHVRYGGLISVREVDR